MYLHEINYKSSVAYNRILKILNGYGISFETLNSGGYINYSIKLIFAGRGPVILSEFPGNCSVLILSEIQAFSMSSGFTALGERFLNAAIDIATDLSYYGLIISGTSTGMFNELVNKHGFTPVIEGIVNPHSGNTNFFLIKKLVEDETE